MAVHKKTTKSVADKGVSRKSLGLKGKRLALALTGGIASTEGVKIIREFRRHGALVSPFMTKDAERFITPLSIEWAAGQKIVTDIGSEVENLEEFDLVVVAPATLNTLSKAALGIADGPVSLLIASQLGNKTPLFFVPTMNLSLRNHPRFLEHKEVLESWKAKFYPEVAEEGRIKMPEASLLVEWVMKELK